MRRLRDQELRDLSLRAASDLVLGVLAVDDSVPAGEVKGIYDRLAADIAASLSKLGRAPGSPPRSSAARRLVLVHGTGGSPAVRPPELVA